MSVKHHYPPKLACAAAILGTLALISCTTVQNRRDLYFPQIVNGPYTRLLHHGLPSPTPSGASAKIPSSSGKEVVKPRG